MEDNASVLPFIVMAVVLVIAAGVSQNWHTRRVWGMFAALCAFMAVFLGVALLLPETAAIIVATAGGVVVVLTHLYYARRILLAGLRNGSVDFYKHRQGCRVLFWSGLVALIVCLVGYYVFEIEWFARYRVMGLVWVVLGAWELVNLRRMIPPAEGGAPDPA